MIYSIVALLFAALALAVLAMNQNDPLRSFEDDAREVDDSGL